VPAHESDAQGTLCAARICDQTAKAATGEASARLEHASGREPAWRQQRAFEVFVCELRQPAQCWWYVSLMVV
jgi:hypothetical protein